MRRLATLTATALITATATATPALATFPGANGLIAYTHDGTVAVLDPVSAKTTDLASGADPEWTPDGSRILFDAEGVVWSMRPDGTGKIAIAPGAGPQVAPSGPAIATEDGERVLIGQEAISDPTENASAPDWGPRGVIVWQSQDRGLQGAGLGGSRIGFDAKGYRMGSPAWAPDGRSILYVQAEDPASPCYSSADPGCPPAVVGIMRLGLDGSRELLRAGVLGDPAPSPDGKRLAYVDGGVIHVDGRAYVPGEDPDWQPLPKLSEPPSAPPNSPKTVTETVGYPVPVPGPERVLYRQADAPACVIPPAKRVLTLTIRVRRAIGRGAISRIRVDLQSAKARVLSPESAGVRIVRLR